MCLQIECLCSFLVAFITDNDRYRRWFRGVLKPIPLQHKLPRFIPQEERVIWCHPQQFRSHIRLPGKGRDQCTCVVAFQKRLVYLTIHHDPTPAGKVILKMVNLHKGSSYTFAAAYSPEQRLQLRVEADRKSTRLNSS